MKFMDRFIPYLVLLYLAGFIVGCSPRTAIEKQAAPVNEVVPLLRAHAHNDYMHQTPLFDALHHGFTSIEADIHLVDGQLYVAHDLENIEDGRTLESLYLDPLKKVIEANDGWVYGDSIQVTLLIDIKSEARETYEHLHAVLAGYASLLTTFENRMQRDGALLVIISGNRSLDYMREQQVRYAGYDGRLSDLEKNYPATLVPLISDRWPTHFNWRGEEPIPVDEHIKLQKILHIAHMNNQRVRFWATPDFPSKSRQRIWNTLYNAGVDLINTDDLDGLQQFLLEKLP